MKYLYVLKKVNQFIIPYLKKIRWTLLHCLLNSHKIQYLCKARSFIQKLIPESFSQCHCLYSHSKFNIYMLWMHISFKQSRHLCFEFTNEDKCFRWKYWESVVRLHKTWRFFKESSSCEKLIANTHTLWLIAIILPGINQDFTMLRIEAKWNIYEIRFFI